MSKCWERQEELNVVLTPCGSVPGYSLALVVSARVSTDLTFSVCAALVLMNSCHCIILRLALRGCWDLISCCTLICTLSSNTSAWFGYLFFFVWFYFPASANLAFFQRENWQESWTKPPKLRLFSFLFVCIGSHFAPQHLNCFCTVDKGKMTSTLVSKQNILNIPLWFFFNVILFLYT